MAAMDTRRLLHTALPYLLLALAFAAVAARCTQGVPSTHESSALAAAQQLLAGGSAACSQWGAAQASGFLLLPASALAASLAQGGAGLVLAVRMLFAAFSFAVALAAFKLLSPRMGQTPALCTCLGFMLCACSGAELIAPFGLCVSLGFGAFACALGSWNLLLEDDGSQTGYARVLLPLGAGLCAVTACIANHLAAPVMACLLLCSLALIARTGARGLMQLLWCAAGAVLGTALFLLVATGFGQPAEVLAALAAGLAAPRLGEAGTAGGVLALLAILPPAALYLGALASGERGLPERVSWACGVALLVLGLAATAAAGLPTAGAGERVQLSSGPLEGIAVSAGEERTYSELLELLAKADEGALFVEGDAQWALLGRSDGYAPLGQAEWVLAVGGEAAGLSEAEYLPFSSNASATLYKHVAPQSFITAG